MRVPLPWLREYCDPDLDVGAIEERLTMAARRSRRSTTTAWRPPTGSSWGGCSPPRSIPTRTSSRRARSTSAAISRRASCAALQRRGRADRRGRAPRRGHARGMKIEKRKLRGIPSEGMICSESELEIGAGGEGIMVLDGLTLDAELAPGTPLAEVLPISIDVVELEITPNRPDCLACTESRASCTLPPAQRSRSRPGARTPAPPARWRARMCASSAPTCARVSPRACSRTSPSLLATVAESAPHRGRAAHDHNVVDITNYAMLAHRPAAARIRPRPASPAPRSPCAARARTSRWRPSTDRRARSTARWC